jgi:predicted aminopeptidase
VLVLGLSACSSVGYLTHLGIGQMQVLLSRERLTPERIAGLSEEERAGLEVLRRAQTFTESLGLSRSTSYRHLIDRGDRGALRVVTAAPADRLEPLTWWFPIVGHVTYRGYFDPERADRFAARLSDTGFDAYVRSAALYSTLGFFDDPVPRSMLLWPPFQIVDTIVHELVHATIFVPDDVDYNESLATFIAHAATLDFFADQPEQVEAARPSFADERTFAELLDGLADEHEELYADTESAEAARTSREAIFRRYQESIFAAQAWKTDRYASFGSAQLSNAYVLAHRAYLGDLPCFEAQLSKLGGDLNAFIRAEREDPGRSDGC